MQACQRGLIEALAEIAAGRLSTQELVRSCLARSAAVEPVVGAFAHFDEAGVLAALAAGPTGPLAGVPVGVKDIIATAGVPTRMERNL